MVLFSLEEYNNLWFRLKMELFEYLSYKLSLNSEYLLLFSHMYNPFWLSLTKIKHFNIYGSLYRETSVINPSNSIC